MIQYQAIRTTITAFLVLALFLITSVTLSFSEAMADGPDSSPSEFQMTPGPVAIHGGSFDPPHYSHADNVAYGLEVLKIEGTPINNAVSLVTKPYKATSSPAWVTLLLNRIHVDSFSTFLELNAIYFKKFISSRGKSRYGQGRSSWISRDGHIKTYQVDDFEIAASIESGNDDKTAANTLDTLRYLKQKYGHGDPRQVYWIAGEDNIKGLPSWTFGLEKTDPNFDPQQWQEVFDHVSWVFVVRPGVNAIDFSRRSGNGPLSEVFPADFLAKYQYRYDEPARQHIYENKDSGKPNIYIVNKPSLDRSSSALKAAFGNQDPRAARQSFKTMSETVLPEVFEECLRQGLYTKAGIPAQAQLALREVMYNAMTRENLVQWIRWRFKQRIENPELNDVDEHDQRDFHEKIGLFLASLEDQKLKKIDSGLDRNSLQGLILNRAAIYKDLAETVNSARWAHLKKKIALFTSRYKLGQFAVAASAAEIIHQTVGQTWQFNPLEMFVIPGYLSLTALRLWRHERADHAGLSELAGSPSRLRDLQNFAHRLLRGDPEAIKARFELTNGLGLAGANIRANIIQSRLPKWLPLSLRRHDDSRVTWHDLNITHNELKAMQDNPGLYAEIASVAGNQPGLLEDLLLKSITMSSNSNGVTKLNLYLTHRYFSRIYLGEVSEELLGEYTPVERNLIDLLQQRSAQLGLKKRLSSEQRKIFGDLISNYYSLVKTAQSYPDLIRDDSFWTTFIDLMVTRYPDRKVQWSDPTQRSIAMKHLSILLPHLAQHEPTLFNELTIRYGNDAIFRIDDNQAVALSPLGELSADEIKVSTALSLYIAADHNDVQTPDLIFHGSASRETQNVQEPQVSNEPATPPPPLVKFIPSASRGHDFSEQNLYWKMHQVSITSQRRLEFLGDVLYGSGMTHLGSQPTYKPIFKAALAVTEKVMEEKRNQLHGLMARWLNFRDLNRFAQIEDQIPGYRQYRGEFEDLNAEISTLLASLEKIVKLMEGNYAPYPESHSSMRQVVLDELRSAIGPQSFHFLIDAQSFGLTWRQRISKTCEELFN